MKTFQKLYDRLENNNIRSLDLFIGEAIQSYLAGDTSKKDCMQDIKIRVRECKEIVKSSNKLLSILKECPQMVTHPDGDE